MTGTDGDGSWRHPYLITVPQAKMTEMEELPPVMLFIMVVEYNPNCDGNQRPNRVGGWEKRRTGWKIKSYTNQEKEIAARPTK